MECEDLSSLSLGAVHIVVHRPACRRVPGAKKEKAATSLRTPKSRVPVCECHIKLRSWVLALLLGFCGILPGLIYAYWLLAQCSHSENEASMQLNLYAMHWISLADGGGTVCETLEIRREKQVQAMLRILTSAVDIHVERS